MRIGRLLIGCLLLAMPAWGLDVRDLADPRTEARWIRDQADVFSRKSEEQLEARLARAREGGAELVVATVWDTGDDTPEKAAQALLNRWQLTGKKAVILIVGSQRRLVVAPASDLTKVLNPALIDRLISTQAAPHLAHRDYGAALVAMVDGMTGDSEDGALTPSWAPPFVREPVGPLAIALAFLGLVPLLLLENLARRQTRAVKRVEMREAHHGFRVRYGLGLAGATATGLFLVFLHPLVGPLGLVIGLGYAAWYGTWHLRLQHTYRTAPLTCECGDQMTALSEAHEEMYLDAERKRLQDLGQKNFVVYLCARCEKTYVEEAPLSG